MGRESGSVLFLTAPVMIVEIVDLFEREWFTDARD